MRPYSPGIDAGDYIYVAGQRAETPDGKMLATFEEQVRQTLENVKAVVDAASLTKKGEWDPMSMQDALTDLAATLASLPDDALCVSVEQQARVLSLCDHYDAKNREEDWFQFQRAILAVLLAECERRGYPAPEAIISGEDAVYRARQIVAWFSDKSTARAC